MMKKLLVAVAVSLALGATPAIAEPQQPANPVSAGAFTVGIVGALLAPTPIGAMYWFGAGVVGAIATYKSN